MLEGRGWVLRTGEDGPWAGWLGLRHLDGVAPLREAPWLAVRALALVDRSFPGGVALVWDAPADWLEPLSPPERLGLLGALAASCRKGLHGGESWRLPFEAPCAFWFHGAEPPVSSLGHAWRQGWIGWVPETPGPWRLPGLGLAGGGPEACPSGALWGELTLPAGALGQLETPELVRVLAEAQARLERNFSHRLASGGWPETFPFHRKRCGWRISLVGGREFRAAGGSWEPLGAALGDLAGTLERELRVPIHVGACASFDVASQLGHQAMREGLPWRYSLALPPASPAFSPGLASDPREPAPLEARVLVPTPLAPILAEPPTVFLRVPTPPQEAACAAFLAGLGHPLPAIHWLPPEATPPGPFQAERPWAPASAFAPLLDVTQALQPGLFDELEG